MRISDWSSDVCSSDLQENDEPAVDMEEVVGESRIFADPQNQTIIFLRDIDLVRNDENHSCLEQALLGGAVIVCVWARRPITRRLQDNLIGDRKSTRLNSSH